MKTLILSGYDVMFCTTSGANFVGVIPITKRRVLITKEPLHFQNGSATVVSEQERRFPNMKRIVIFLAALAVLIVVASVLPLTAQTTPPPTHWCCSGWAGSLNPNGKSFVIQNELAGPKDGGYSFSFQVPPGTTVAHIKGSISIFADCYRADFLSSIMIDGNSAWRNITKLHWGSQTIPLDMDIPVQTNSGNVTVGVGIAAIQCHTYPGMTTPYIDWEIQAVGELQ